MLRSSLLSIFLLGVLRVSAADNTSNAMTSEILAASANVSAALAADNLAAAKTAAADVASHAGMANNNALVGKANAVAKAATIEDARKELSALMAAVEPLAAGRKDYVVMHCPMAAADWIQSKGKTQNPYYGKSMLTCGGPKKSK